jgi:hypothetical protein
MDSQRQVWSAYRVLGGVGTMVLAWGILELLALAGPPLFPTLDHATYGAVATIIGALAIAFGYFGVKKSTTQVMTSERLLRRYKSWVYLGILSLSLGLLFLAQDQLTYGALNVAVGLAAVFIGRRKASSTSHSLSSPS